VGCRHGIQDEDRERDAGVTQLQGLVERRDREAVRARGLEGERDRDGAVPVRVGLDDGLDPDARPGDRAERGQIPAQRVEVELQPGGAWQRRQARAPQARLDRLARRNRRTPRRGSPAQRSASP
jgi:hypothetical protein